MLNQEGLFKAYLIESPHKTFLVFPIPIKIHTTLLMSLKKTAYLLVYQKNFKQTFEKLLDLCIQLFKMEISIEKYSMKF
jgi:hypothetical protein